MKPLFSLVVAACLTLGSLNANAQLARQSCPGASSLCNPVPAPPAGCAQATNFLARATGMDATHNNAFTTLICGLVTDGVITGTMAGSATSGATACGSLIDVLYIMATDTAAHALLNLCSTAFTASNSSGPTFTADLGFFSSGAGIIDSTYVPSTAAGNLTQNSASIGDWSFTTSQQANNTVGVSGTGATNYLIVLNQFTDGRMYCAVNDGDGGSEPGATVTDGSGFFLCNRNSSTTLQMYRNAVLLIPSAGSVQTSTGLADRTAYASGMNNNGAVVVSNRSAAMFLLGGNLSSGNVTAINSRVCAYLTTVHGSC